MKSCLFYFLIGILLCSSVSAQISDLHKKKLIYQDDFQQGLDTTLWKTEIAPLAKSSVDVRNGKLVIDTKGGVTVWFKKKLKTNIEIRYNWTVIVNGGNNDRLSDLNQFWMATDPRKSNLFTRTGVLETYDSLSLYYVGMGGNTNKTTRFRKYPGNGQRVLISEFKDQEHLLTANHTYQIKIIVKNPVTEFWVDGNLFFSYKDENSLASGYFGFRSTGSHHEIDDFQVYQLLD